MKITKSQLKEIIKEELGRIDYRTEFESIDADLEKIQMMTTPDFMKSGERVDVVLDQEDIMLINQTVDAVRDTISEYITQMMRER